MQQELVNLYQFLYHVTIAVIFQVKSWPESTSYFFIDWELVSTLLKNNPRNPQKLLIIKNFSFFFIEVLNFKLKVLL